MSVEMLDNDVYPAPKVAVEIGLQFSGSTPVRRLIIH